MEVKYSPKVLQDIEVLPLLKQATVRLESIPGVSTKDIKVEWERMQDPKDIPSFVLAIHDGSGDSASTIFNLEEVRNPLLMRIRVTHLLGDFLAIRQERVHKQSQMLLSEISTDAEEN